MVGNNQAVIQERTRRSQKDGSSIQISFHFGGFASVEEAADKLSCTFRSFMSSSGEKVFFYSMSRVEILANHQVVLRTQRTVS